MSAVVVEPAPTLASTNSGVGEDERAKLATRNGLATEMDYCDQQDEANTRVADLTLNGTTEANNCTMDDSECNITVIHVSKSSTTASQDILLDSSLQDDKSCKEFGSSVESKDSKDGSDSGVEGCGAVEQPRVPSRNSGDYASSSNGLDEASCDSSLVSCCSVYEDAPCANLPEDVLSSLAAAASAGKDDAPNEAAGATSEGGSESSSVAGSVASGRVQKRASSLCAAAAAGVDKTKRKLTTRGSIDSHASSRPVVNGTTSTGARLTRQKPAVPAKSLALPKSQSSNRGRTREKPLVRTTKEADGRSTASASSSSSGGGSTAQASTAASRSRARPDSLPSALATEISKDLAQRGAGVRPRGGSTTRAPSCTPSSEDARKSFGRSSSLYSGRLEARSTRQGTDTTSGRALEAYGTLPRTARHKLSSAEKPPAAANRSRSRDASLNRLLGRKGLPPYPKCKPERTRIYQETGVQTGLTGEDIDSCLAGVATIIPNPESVDTLEVATQTEGSWEDLRRLKEQLGRVSAESEESKREKDRLKAELERLKKSLEEEKSDHAFARQELDKNAQRVLAMLGTPTSDARSDSFLELETQIQSSGQVVASQQVEIADLQSLCRMLSRDLEKSLAAQKTLLQQQQELEAESAEMQDFLQEEKAALEIALKESESESRKKDETMKQLSSELERQTEECKHLVRISEQRRQENLSSSMKLNAIERRSKELLLAQGAAASGASVALSGLGSRLEALVDQLIVSYNISEKDLEDIIYHNEAFSRSNSSIESSPVSSKHSLKDCTPSPKRGSFVSAVIGAIRNAAAHPFATRQANEKKSADSSRAVRKELSSMESSSDILDFETEPCLMMESVLEDVPLPDTYSHNMVSSCDSLRRVLSVPESVDEHNLRRSKLNGESSSLSNLTQAILNRRRVEDEEEENYESISESENGPSDGPLPLTDYCPATSLVDQVIDVDNLVTKLLKVLRIIQLDNDTCIQELKDERAELEAKLEILLVDRKTVENGRVAENEILTNGNGVHDETIVVQICKNVIKEMKESKELITDGQIEQTNCISDESSDGDQNATILLSPSS